MSDSASLKGGLTVEASLVMSVFLLGVNLLFYFFFLLEFQTELQFALENTVRTEAIYCSAASGIPEAMVREAVSRERALSGSRISMGSGGIFVIRNQSDNPEFLDISLSYEAGPALNFLGSFKGRYLQRSIRRFWNGQERISGEGEDEEAAAAGMSYVYITQNGTVYHNSRECSYLSLSIRQIPAGTVSSLRNESGEKYKPCESCAKTGQATGTVYITDTGNRYHRIKSCGGLQRWVIKIPFSETEGRPACSRCGG